MYEVAVKREGWLPLPALDPEATTGNQPLVVRSSYMTGYREPRPVFQEPPKPEMVNLGPHERPRFQREYLLEKLEERENFWRKQTARHRAEARSLSATKDRVGDSETGLLGPAEVPASPYTAPQRFNPGSLAAKPSHGTADGAAMPDDSDDKKPKPNIWTATLALDKQIRDLLQPPKHIQDFARILAAPVPYALAARIPYELDFHKQRRDAYRQVYGVDPPAKKEGPKDAPPAAQPEAAPVAETRGLPTTTAKGSSMERDETASRPDPSEQQVGSDPSLAPFDIPTGTEWTAIKIRFTDDHHVQMSVGGRIDAVSFATLGFEDRRGEGGKPVSSWVLLRTFATQNGSMERPEAGTKALIIFEKAVQDLRRRLRGFFKIAEEPVPFNRKDKCYRTAFKVEFPHSDRL